MSFLKIEEIPDAALRFKDEWFYVAQRCEALSGYRSCLESGFAEALEDIQARASNLATLINELCVSCQRYAPERKSEFEDRRRKMEKALNELAAALGEDAKAIKAYAELLPRLQELSRNLEAARKRYEEKHSEAQKAHENYEAAKHDYEQKVQSIKSATDKEIEKLRRSFLDEMRQVLEGYTITLRGEGGEITPEVLFEEFARDPEYHNKIDIKAGGISGILAKRGDARARLMLFRYKAEETYKQIAPILEEEKRRIAGFEGELNALKELQRQSEALRKEDEKALSQVKNLERIEEELQKKEEMFAQKFKHYERVLDLREAYLKKLNESGDARKELLSLVETLRGIELPEQDVEKRELRGEIEALRENVSKLQGETAQLREQLKAKTARELELSKIAEELKIREKALRDDLLRLKEARAKLESERTQLQRQLELKIASEAQLSKNLSEAREKERALKESAAKLKLEKDEIEARLKGVTDALERTLDKFEAEAKGRARLEDENRKLKVNLEEALGKVEQLLSKYEAEKEVAERLREEAKAVEELKKSKEKLEEDNRKLKAMLEEAIGKAKEVLSKYEAAQSEIEKLKAEAAKSRQAEDFIPDRDEPPEKEVETVIGEKIHALRKRNV